MALSRCDEGIGSEDIRIFRLNKVCTCEARHTFHLIFEWGCKRDVTKSLKDHLYDMGMNSKDFKHFFNADMRKKIENNYSGDDFDLTLLFACIQTACPGLAERMSSDWKAGDDTKLESVCTFIKNFRNNLVHESKISDDAKMNTLLSSIQDKLEKAIKLAGKLYEHPPSEIDNEVKDMNDNIKKIMNAPIITCDVKDYLKEIKELREKQKNLVKEEAAPELIHRYESISRVDPASFITGNERLQVKNVFTRLEVIREQISRDMIEYVDYEALLTLTAEGGGKPVVTVVEGDAGAGKTTLTKLILDDWSSLKTSRGTTTFHDLDTYDLVLYAEARNKSVDSLESLLSVLMPKVRNQLTDEDLLRSLGNLRVLLIIDGLDEWNHASKKLIDEIFEKHLPASDGKLRLLITTRPIMFLELPGIIRNNPKVYARLRGIAREKREEYVQRLHEEMINENQSNQRTQDLVDYLKQSHTRLGEHYRLPLNLTLLTYLWADNPKRVNLVTTATGLYIALHELVQKRLIERLKNSSCEGTKLEEAHEKFLHELYHVCLETLSSGKIQLSSKSVERLIDICDDLNKKLPEMSAPFLVLEKEWTSTGYEFDYYVPHKSIMEFYAAFGILCSLTVKKKHPLKDMPNLSEEDRKKIHEILEESYENQPKKLIDIMQSLLQKDIKTENMSDYQNMFLHLGGLLAHKQPDVLQQYGEQLVQLLQRSRMKEPQWLDLVVETNCDDKMTSLVAPLIKKEIVVRDGHTGAALKLFSYLADRTPVQIIMENEVHSIPKLDELLDEVSRRPCDVELLLKHQWKHSQYGSSDDLLKNLVKDGRNPKFRLSRFWGYLKSFAVLPLTVTSLHINIVDNDHAKALCSEFATLTERLALESLGKHQDAVHPSAGSSINLQQTLYRNHFCFLSQ